ncbi:MAG TPA: hypothetical protein VNN18_02125 [Candidatus Xenobia bacterium]|nr:hypothetical protein [Candidatus Xenobia bacterium]
MLARLFLLAAIVFGLELGLFLVVLPWSSLWEYNYFLLRFPAAAPWLLNDFVRGGVSGLGLIDIGLALSAALRFTDVLEEWFEPAPAEPVLAPPSGVGRGRTA